jgi:hypothetical protein
MDNDVYNDVYNDVFLFVTTLISMVAYFRTLVHDDDRDELTEVT